MTESRKPSPLTEKISDYCQVRVAPFTSTEELSGIRTYMIALIMDKQLPPIRNHAYHWVEIATQCQISFDRMKSLRGMIEPALDAVTRSTGGTIPQAAKRTRLTEGSEPAESTQGSHFSNALDVLMQRHGDNCATLRRAISKPGDKLTNSTIRHWRLGTKAPHNTESFELLDRIAERYELPAGYFKAMLPNRARSARGHSARTLSSSERRRFAWHLPEDFNLRPIEQQNEIVDWVRRVILEGTTEYRRYQAAAMKQRFSLRFSDVLRPSSKYRQQSKPKEYNRSRRIVNATRSLKEEMADLVQFKTSTLTAAGLQRQGVWGEETTSQKIEHLSLMFGALAADPDGPVNGYGVPHHKLAFGMLVFPSVWDWYVQWRERRRGFYTSWEVDMLRISLALTRKETGWLRQHPNLIEKVHPIEGLISRNDIKRARQDWDNMCDNYFKHATSRVKEIQRVARVHRDPFEPIMPVLEAESPVGEYRKITEEILRLMPDERFYRRAAAEAVRSFLMLRLGLHLGLRQRNLRQLMVCERGCTPRSERHLSETRRGELRWNNRDQGWEVFIPAVAFKNADSSYFGSKPFRLILPDLGQLYEFIEAYIARHRRVLLGNAEDPGTFFVKTVKVTSKDASYDQNTFYEAWRLTIQRYGIYNPYTKRGAIPGLLPHGPHNVRDVLATHILKKTGSYEQASYAIQDTPDMVANHYGRFLPQDKAALAARILNEAWQSA